MLGRSGGGGHAPPDFFYKNDAIWRNLSVPKYVIIKLKTNNFKDNLPQYYKLFAISVTNTKSRFAC